MDEIEIEIDTEAFEDAKHESSANDIYDEMSGLLNGLRSEAVHVLNESASEVRAWLKSRLERVGYDEAQHNYKLEVNKYNESGYGLQSVSVRILDEAGNSMLDFGECDDPTIGIVAPGMLDEEGEYRVVDFDIDDEKSESITVLSEDGMLIGMVDKNAEHENVPITLKQDNPLFISGDTHKARAVVELRKNSNARRVRIRKILKKGVYVCEYYGKEGG